MPGAPRPVGSRGDLPPLWNAVLTLLQSHSQGIAALTAGATQGNLLDAWGNTVELGGTNLGQTVFIGAAFGQAGVQVATGLTGAGRAKQANLATGTITTTAGSTAATLVSTTSGAFAANQAIGAANVKDPSTGTATPAITPGTTISGITGSAITLSAPAAETGSSLFAAAANFTRM